MKKDCMLYPALVLVILLIGLSGCGSNAGSQPPGGSGDGARPDRVQIEIESAVDPTHKPSAVPLTDVSLTRQLYATILALPTLPPNQVCTQEMGPSYTLKFFQGDKVLATVNAQRYGCKVVQITGEQQQRQANQQFWTQLDQAISHFSILKRIDIPS